MGFVDDFPKIERAGRSKYEKELMKMVNKPNAAYEFEEGSNNPGSVAVGLKKNKLVQEIEQENNGEFEFKSINGKIYGIFRKGTKTPKRKKK